MNYISMPSAEITSIVDGGSAMEAGIKEGDKIQVKLIDIDPKTGKFKLSKRALTEKPEGYEERPARQPRQDRGDRPERGERRDRGPRRNDERKNGQPDEEK